MDIGGSEPLVKALQEAGLADYAALVPAGAAALRQHPHGDDACWQAVLAALPVIEQTGGHRAALNRAAVGVLSAAAPAAAVRLRLRQALLRLRPWRKGPFTLFGVHIDSEWRSNLKWNRLHGKISPLRGRRVLDVGCGNGYYLFRMAGAGASVALGIDPGRLCWYQFAAVQRYLRQPNCFMLPLGSAALPAVRPLSAQGFDTVFSLGVLYHRRDPMQHLTELLGCLRAGGELVLETLILPGDGERELIPDRRYARMRNVWSLPTLARLLHTLESAGLRQLEVIDVSRTTSREQRATEWMPFQSLNDFLDPDDASLTIEGYPAPTRALVKAVNPA